MIHQYEADELSIEQVVDQVSHLFRNHNPELLTEFAFMPDDVQVKYGAASDFAAMTGAKL